MTLRGGHDGAEVTEFAGDDLLALPVRLHGLELGRPVDLLLDRETLRAVGLDVLCKDGAHRFLPLLTASVSEKGLNILSPLVLLEGEELDFYRSRTFALSSLRRRAVQRHGTDVGNLLDIVLAADGSVRTVMLENGERISFEDTLQFAPPRRTAA